MLDKSKLSSPPSKFKALHTKVPMTEELKTVPLHSREDGYKVTGRLERAAINGLSPILLNTVEPQPYSDNPLMMTTEQR